MNTSLTKSANTMIYVKGINLTRLVNLNRSNHNMIVLRYLYQIYKEKYMGFVTIIWTLVLKRHSLVEYLNVFILQYVMVFLLFGSLFHNFLNYCFRLHFKNSISNLFCLKDIDWDKLNIRSLYSWVLISQWNVIFDL